MKDTNYKIEIEGIQIEDELREKLFEVCDELRALTEEKLFGLIKEFDDLECSYFDEYTIIPQPGNNVLIKIKNNYTIFDDVEKEITVITETGTI